MEENGKHKSDDGLSAVILTYNTPLTLLEQCLRAIYRHNDIGEKLEVIVVDNNGDNQAELLQMVKHDFSKVRFVGSRVNGGYGAGNNLGIQHSQYDFVLLINPDVELVEPVFQWAVKRFVEDAQLTLLGMQQVDQYNNNVHSFLMRKMTVSNFWANFFLDKISRFSPRFSVIGGACFFLRKIVFLEIGGYDPSIFLYGEERYLHEHILNHTPESVISMDLTKKYKHAISDRPFSSREVELGMTSYFYLQRKLGRPHQATFKSVVRYLKFLTWFYRVKNKKTTVANTKETIKLVKGKFGSAP